MAICPQDIRNRSEKSPQVEYLITNSLINLIPLNIYSMKFCRSQKHTLFPFKVHDLSKLLSVEKTSDFLIFWKFIHLAKLNHSCFLLFSLILTLKQDGKVF